MPATSEHGRPSGTSELAAPSDSGPPEVSTATLALICLLTAIPPISMEIYIPSLPSIEADMDTTTTNVMYTITVYTVAFSVMQLILGPASDVYGRRRPLLIGLSVYFMACVVTALAPSIGWMLAPRVLQGASSAGAMCISQATLRDLLTVTRRERVTRWMAVVRSSAPLLAPAVGSLVQAALGWRANFWVLTLMGMFALLGVITILPESLPKARRQPRFGFGELVRAICFLLCRRDFTCWAVPEALGFAGFFVWITTSSYILQEFYGVSVATFGLLYCLCFIGATAGSFATRFVRERIGLSPRGTYVLGSSLSLGCATVLLIASFTPLMTTPSAASEALLQTAIGVYIFGRSLCAVQAQVQGSEPFPTRAAACAGLMGAMRSAAMSTVATFASYTLRDGTPANACRTIFALAFLSHTSHLLLRPRSSTRATPKASVRIIDPASNTVADDAIEELAAAHAAAREEAREAAEVAARMPEVACDSAGEREEAVDSPAA